MDPLASMKEALDRAIKAVPSMRYAAAAVAIGAAVGLMTIFLAPTKNASVAVVIAVALMIVLVLFNAIAKRGSRVASEPARFLVWSIAVLFVAAVALPLAAVSFGRPETLARFLGVAQPGPSPTPVEGEPPSPASYLEKSTLRLGMDWDAFVREMKEVDYDLESSPGKLTASYSGRFWDLPARITHLFKGRKLETSLIEIVAEDCDAVLYDYERRPIGTLSGQCGIGAAHKAAEICAVVDEQRKEQIDQSGGAFDELSNQYIGQQWLDHQIILQNDGNGWAEAPTKPGDRQIKATMERFKLSDSVYAQFQAITWKLSYSAFDPGRLGDAEIDYSAGPPYANSNHYTRSGCVLRYRLSAQQNTPWDFKERKY